MQIKKGLKQMYSSSIALINEILYRFYTGITWRQKRKNLLKSPAGLRLHLGCGDKKYPNMLNCEFRATKAADLIQDCSNLKRFKENSATLIFSHAFFEHLYKDQQLPLLKDCYRVLKEDGVLLFIGIPDFEIIADYYYNKKKGIPGYSENGEFDLYHVYRYTHGDPEGAGPNWWLEQLHKSIFDKQFLTKSLAQAGFSSVLFFNYSYPGEDIPLNLGFYAKKSKKEMAKEQVLNLLNEFKDNIGTVFVWK